MSTKIEIDPEFQALLPALTKSQKDTLETLIVAEGCKEAITVWNGLLADGHNRYEICTRLGIHYRTNYIDLPDRDAVMLWMLNNQDGRRNLSDIDSISVARKREEIIARRAKQNQRLADPNKEGLSISTNLIEPVRTRAESAKSAGVGVTKYDEGKLVLEAVESGELSPDVLDKIRAKETTIHTVAKELKEARKPAPVINTAKPVRNNYRPEYGVEIATKAIATLERITKDDRQFEAGHRLVLEFCERQLNQK